MWAVLLTLGKTSAIQVRNTFVSSEQPSHLLYCDLLCCCWFKLSCGLSHKCVSHGYVMVFGFESWQCLMLKQPFWQLAVIFDICNLLLPFFHTYYNLGRIFSSSNPQSLSRSAAQSKYMVFVEQQNAEQTEDWKKGNIKQLRWPHDLWSNMMMQSLPITCF